MVSAIQPVTGHALARGAVVLHHERSSLSEDEIDGCPTIHVRVPVGEGHVLQQEGVVVSKVPLEGPRKHGGGLDLVQISHPGHSGRWILGLHCVEVAVDVAQLALVQLGAASVAGAEVRAARDEEFGGEALPQDYPISSPGAPPGAARGLSNAPLQGLPAGGVVEDVGAVALPRIASWLGCVLSLRDTRQGCGHLLHCCC
mmetsp:Transcript_18694/g.40066  ORF Transcript_18694/g.40066 Transcript_18694/m.40066 type:complete len:200 (+) Transcript_18694:547-1146(+)